MVLVQNLPNVGKYHIGWMASEIDSADLGAERASQRKHVEMGKSSVPVHHALSRDLLPRKSALGTAAVNGFRYQSREAAQQSFHVGEAAGILGDRATGQEGGTKDTHDIRCRDPGTQLAMPLCLSD